MRNLKAILTCGGEKKRKSKDQSEDLVVMNALISVNLPKFTTNDKELFLGIISDLFVGMKLDLDDIGIFVDHLKE